ncbi:hypothetical protein P7C73_g3848, partial [Tremellales sp. Uapishka_1]
MTHLNQGKGHPESRLAVISSDCPSLSDPSTVSRHQLSYCLGLRLNRSRAGRETKGMKSSCLGKLITDSLHPLHLAGPLSSRSHLLSANHPHNMLPSSKRPTVSKSFDSSQKHPASLTQKREHVSSSIPPEGVQSGGGGGGGAGAGSKEGMEEGESAEKPGDVRITHPASWRRADEGAKEGKAEEGQGKGTEKDQAKGRSAKL